MDGEAQEFAIIRVRGEAVRKWLFETHPECFREQKHLEDGTAERAYWHYGYQAAITDMLNLFMKDGSDAGTAHNGGPQERQGEAG